jgi:hypothetical protein
MPHQPIIFAAAQHWIKENRSPTALAAAAGARATALAATQTPAKSASPATPAPATKVQSLRTNFMTAYNTYFLRVMLHGVRFFPASVCLIFWPWLHLRLELPLRLKLRSFFPYYGI